jgi:hypothetical protein
MSGWSTLAVAIAEIFALSRAEPLPSASAREALAGNARNAERYVDRLCEDARSLRERPPLRVVLSRERDAAPFLAPLVDSAQPRLRLGEALRARLRSYGADWPARITDEDVAGLDFRWMRALAPFDHWSLLGAGRFRDSPALHFFDGPFPEYGILVEWSKLRYAVALRRHDGAAASTEVRHLADLVRTQSTMLAEMIAVALYRLDSRACEAFVATRQDVCGSRQPDLDQMERYRRSTFASIYFAYPGVAPATVRRAASCMPSPCPALIEAAAGNRAFGAFATPDNLPLTIELTRSFGCDGALLDRAAHGRRMPAAEAAKALAEVANRLPDLLDAR